MIISWHFHWYCGHKLNLNQLIWFIFSGKRPDRSHCITPNTDSRHLCDNESPKVAEGKNRTNRFQSAWNDLLTFRCLYFQSEIVDFVKLKNVFTMTLLTDIFSSNNYNRLARFLLLSIVWFDDTKTLVIDRTDPLDLIVKPPFFPYFFRSSYFLLCSLKWRCFSGAKYSSGCVVWNDFFSSFQRKSVTTADSKNKLIKFKL